MRTLLLYSAGDAGLNAVDQAFGAGGARLPSFPGVRLQIAPEVDHVLTALSMRDDVAARLASFVTEVAVCARRAERLCWWDRPPAGRKGRCMTIRETILTQVQDIASQNGKTLAPLTDELPLLDSGLDSLCIAILVANLEDELDLDPFSAGHDVPVTLGDFIRLYENAAG